jgi:hypothetical protein
MKYIFCAEKHRRRMQAAGTPIPVIIEPLLVQMDGKEIETVCDTYDGNTLNYGFVYLFPSFPVKVDLIDCDEEAIPVENSEKTVVLSMEHGDVRVSFNTECSGNDNSENCVFLQLNVERYSPFSDGFEEENSVCTQLFVDTPKPIIERALNAILDCLCEDQLRQKLGSSMRLQMDFLSNIDKGNIDVYEKEAADAKVMRHAYEKYKIVWMADHSITMEDISNEAENWMEEYRFDAHGYPSLGRFIERHGFHGGEIYPCYDEFISNEFGDVDFMLNLLPEEKHEGYLRALGVKAQFCKPNETEKQAEDRVRYIRYWSNACGDLHHFGECDITEEELPAELQKAYYSIWSERYYFPCYLVETADGYRGVALIAEFEKDDFTFAKKAAVLLSDYFGENLCVVLLESPGYDGAHELVVIVPASSSEHYMKDVNEKMYHVCLHR